MKDRAADLAANRRYSNGFCGRSLQPFLYLDCRLCQDQLAVLGPGGLRVENASDDDGVRFRYQIVEAQMLDCCGMKWDHEPNSGNKETHNQLGFHSCLRQFRLCFGL